jgi:hypothetical protein
MSELVLMDQTYDEKIALRRRLIGEHGEDVVACNPVARDAVLELYAYLFETYLPRRFPSMFALQSTKKVDEEETVRVVKNLVTGDEFPLDLETSDMDSATEGLRRIGRHVDGEFAILLPSSNPEANPFRTEPTTEPEQVYHLHAFVLVFPSGFNTPGKLGLPLAGKLHFSSSLEDSERIDSN